MTRITGQNKLISIEYFWVAIAILLCLIGCSVFRATSAINEIDKTVDTIRTIVLAHSDALTKHELESLRSSYYAWQKIKKTLKDRGCDLSSFSQKVCRIDVSTVKILHEFAHKQYSPLKNIALAHWGELDESEKQVLMDFNKKLLDFDQAVMEFEKSPDAQKELEILQALTAFAVIARKAIPIILKVV